MTRPVFADRRAIEEHQLAELSRLLSELLPSNHFYARKLDGAGVDGRIASLKEFTLRAPLTTRHEITEDQRASPPYGTNLTYPLDRYSRFSQTSATTGNVIRWLDTAESWQWMADNWKQVFEAAGAQRGDRVFFAFSFGPFLGFWTAFEAAAQLGLMCIPGGAMSSTARLQCILDNRVTMICCTPTYALHLGQVGVEQKIDLRGSSMRRIIVAGEPGGSVPATRAQIEQLWPGASVFDHHGMTDVGPVSFQNPNRSGVLHVIEYAYLAEIIDPANGSPVAADQTGELVLTTLGRTGSPLLRYRTGDLVQRSTLDAQILGRAEIALQGGILGRADDMVQIRGVNVFPSAVDEIVRGHVSVAEYRVEVFDGPGQSEMQLTIEPTAGHDDTTGLCERLAEDMRNAFHLRVPVSAVAPGELPRFEMKAKRWVRRGDA